MATADSIRYQVLDSWRGIAALFVVLYHFRIHSNIATWALIDGSYLFVDFFFVLSGFVIAANYGSRLSDTSGVLRFVILRFGRLYPLHFFMLTAYVSLESIGLLIPAAGSISLDGVFASERNSPYAIFTNLLLIHSLGIHDSVTWNLPSWTISVEFYTYIIFAALIWLIHRQFTVVTVLIIAASMILVASVSEKMDVSYDYGLFRCLAGFFAGCLCYQVFRRTRELIQPQFGLIGGTLVEVAAILCVVAFIVMFAQRQWSIAAPLLFSVVVFVFAFEKGWMSDLLKCKLLLLMGAISYSIYMTHQFVQARIFNVCDLLSEYSDHPVISAIKYRAGGLSESDRIHGDIGYVPMLLAVVAVSYLTYRFVEIPFRSRFRRVADGVGRGPSRRLGGLGSGRAGRGAAMRSGGFWSFSGWRRMVRSSQFQDRSPRGQGVGWSAGGAAEPRRSASHPGATGRAWPPGATAAGEPAGHLQAAYRHPSELLGPFTPRGPTGGVSRPRPPHARNYSEGQDDD